MKQKIGANLHVGEFKVQFLKGDKCLLILLTVIETQKIFSIPCDLPYIVEYLGKMKLCLQNCYHQLKLAEISTTGSQEAF